MKKNKLVVLYGPRKIGKTSLLMKVVHHLQRSGYLVSGVISPAIFENQEKIGIQIQNVATGEVRSLAHRRVVTDQLDATPGYQFDEINLAWGDAIFGKAIPTEVLIVDELGPLEIKFGKGWQQGVNVVVSGEYDLCIVVLREELHELVLDQWKVTDWVEFHAGLEENCFDQYLIEED